MPNKENIRKLVEALRSGQYKQSQGRLAWIRDGIREYCCLGVACEVAIANGLNIEVIEGVEYNRVTFDGEPSVLPNKVAQWYEFDELESYNARNPKLIDEFGQHNSAAELNDNFGYNFSRIADAFERTYLSEETNNAE